MSGDTSKVASSDEKSIIVRIDYCVMWNYEGQANQFYSELVELVPELNLVLSLNPDGIPKPGSFEITIVKPSGSSKKIWYGLDLDVAGEVKFPVTSVLVDVVRAFANES